MEIKASTSIAIEVKAGFLASMRTPNLRSRHKPPIILPLCGQQGPAPALLNEPADGLVPDNRRFSSILTGYRVIIAGSARRDGSSHALPAPEEGRILPCL
jgi:hypothetical protein